MVKNLSDQRAECVRAYLVAQGVLTGSVTAKGFGKTQPVGTTIRLPAGRSTAGLNW